MLVAVDIAGDTDPRWVELLAPRLAGHRVVAATDAVATDADAVVVGNPAVEQLSRYHRVRFVQSTWAGPDRLAASPWPVARMVGGALGQAMTEFVVAAVLFCHRQFPAYANAQRARRWEPRDQPLAAQRPIGLLGVGELGRPVAVALSALGFPVTGWATRDRDDPIPVLSGWGGLDELLTGSQILVNLLPLDRSTAGLLDRDRLGRLPRGACVVNPGRGATVEEAALLDALDAGHLTHAVLDVFTTEPLPSGHRFWRHERVSVFPHVAAESRAEDLAADVAANLSRFLTGESPIGLLPDRSGG